MAKPPDCFPQANLVSDRAVRKALTTLRIALHGIVRFEAALALVSRGPPEINSPGKLNTLFRVQMIRGIGVKVKEFVLNGCFDWLYGTKSPVNGFRKSLDIKVFGRLLNDTCHRSK